MSEETKLENITLPDLAWDPDNENCTEKEEDPDLVEHDRLCISFDTRACLEMMWRCGACEYRDETAQILISPASARQKAYAIICTLMPHESDPDDCNSDDELELRRLHDWLSDYYDRDREEDFREEEVEDVEREFYNKLIQPFTDRVRDQGWLDHGKITVPYCIIRHNSWFVGGDCLEDPNYQTPDRDTAFIHTLRWLYGKNDWEN